MADDLFIRSRVIQIHDIVRSVQGDVSECRRYIERRLDTLGDFVNTLFEPISRQLADHDRRFEAIIENMTDLDQHINQRLATIEQRLGTLDQNIAPLDRALNSLNQLVTAIGPRLTALDERIAAVNPRLGNIEQRLDSLLQQINIRFTTLDQQTTALNQNHYHDQHYDILTTQLRELRADLRSR